MSLTLWLLLVAVACLVAFLYPLLRKKWLLSRPFSPQWQLVIRQYLPFFDRMSADEKSELEKHITLFIADKRFHGCGGLSVNDEIKVAIAAQACLLVLNRGSAVYPRLKHILVYPDAFVARREQVNQDGTGTFSEQKRGMLGESWQAGKVILSWADVVKGTQNVRDGHNVAIHEFSHQLDSESGSANGAPPLRRARYPQWEKILSREFDDLQKALRRHKRHVMDYYGATNPAEFFAVATETFFEKPYRMYRRHPQLFEELQAYYRVDPRKWFDPL